MRQFVILGPSRWAIEEQADLVPRQGEVVVRVEAAGLCGTDRELFDGSMPYIGAGITTYPFVPGHEWAGTVIATGPGARTPKGTRVTGDVFIPCGACDYCKAGRINACPDRYEIGVRRNWPGAIADQIRVPEAVVHHLPDAVGTEAAVFAEPGVTALHALERCDLKPDELCLVIGSGTLSLLALQIAISLGAVAHCATNAEAGRDRALTLGASEAISPGQIVPGTYDVAIEAAGRHDAPGQAVGAVKAGGRVGLIGVSTEVANLDANDVVLRDITVHGVIGGPGRFPRILQLIRSGAIVTEPLIGARVSLDEVADVLQRPAILGAAPKTIVTWSSP